MTVPPSPSKSRQKPTSALPALSPILQRAAQEELASRARKLAARKKTAEPTEAEREAADALYANLLPEQQDLFFLAAKEGRRRVGRGTRRMGKTTGAAIKILITMLRDPHAVCLFVAQTRTIIEDTVWPELLRIIGEYNLPFKPHGTKLRLSHTRGQGRAIFRGASDTKNIQKLRGLGTGGKFVLAILDESGHYGANFEKLVLSVISPGLRDCLGELILIGTPGEYPEGLFYEATSGLAKGWVRRFWTLQQNTKLSPEARDLERIRDEEGLTEDDPVYIREWLGQYCLNLKTQMFEYDPAKNSYEGPVPDTLGGWTYWAGIDFGWTDETSIVVLAFNLLTREMYAPESWSASEQTSDMVHAQMARLKAAYGITRWVGDTGGYGKGTAMQIMTDYGVWIDAANKMEKLNHVAFINSAFRRQNLWVRRHTGLSAELPKVLWNPDRTNAHKHAKDNNSMALLYVWRAAQNVAGKRNATPDNTPPEMAGWPAEEIRAKLGNTIDAAKAETPWFLQDLYGGPTT